MKIIEKRIKLDDRMMWIPEIGTKMLWISEVGKPFRECEVVKVNDITFYVSVDGEIKHMFDSIRRGARYFRLYRPKKHTKDIHQRVYLDTPFTRIELARRAKLREKAS